MGSSRPFLAISLALNSRFLPEVTRLFTFAWTLRLLQRRRAKVFLFLFIFVLCAVRATIGLIDSRHHSHDAFMLLDGAWRMLNGQRPHLDFNSHLGFLAYVPTLAGLELSHGTAWGAGYGQSLVGLLIGCWAYALGRKRLLDVPLILFCLCITFVAVAPFALGEPVVNICFATSYNRFGYAFLALLLLEALAGPKQSENRETRGGFSSGIILGILLFLKITFFVVGCVQLIALIPCRAQSKRRWLSIALGFMFLLLAGCAYLNFQVMPMLKDLLMIAGAKRIHFGEYLLDDILIQALGIGAFALAATLLLVSDDNYKSATKVLWGSLVVILTGAVLIFGNYEPSGFPLGVFLALFVLNEITENALLAAAPTGYFRFSVMLAGSVFVAGALFSGSLSTVTAFAGRFYIPYRVAALRSPILSGFLPAGKDFSYGVIVNDGMELLQRFRRPADNVMSLDFSNPFSYGLAIKPAPGGTTVLQYETTFDDTHHQPPRDLFGEAQLVMVPDEFSDGTLPASIARIYGPYLTYHFHLIGVSKFWQLYRKN